MLTRSWGLFCACCRVLKSQPSLMIYPIISGISSFLFVAIFLVPLYFGGFLDTFLPQQQSFETQQSFTSQAGIEFIDWQAWLVIFLLGLILNLVTNFCNAAFTAATLIRLSGSQVTVGEAFGVAADRFPAILGYSLIGATVGMVMRAIEERVGFLGRLIGLFAGLAWAVVTFLVLPVLVVENVGPIEGIRRSIALLRRAWGEGVICNVGIGAATGLLSFAFFLCGVMALLIAVSLGSAGLAIMAVFGTVAGLVAIGVLARTLTGIFTAALYAYATGRGMMPGIPSELIINAFGPKKKGVF